MKNVSLHPLSRNDAIFSAKNRNGQGIISLKRIEVSFFKTFLAERSSERKDRFSRLRELKLQQEIVEELRIKNIVEEV